MASSSAAINTENLLASERDLRRVRVDLSLGENLATSSLSGERGDRNENKALGDGLTRCRLVFLEHGTNEQNHNDVRGAQARRAL